jgi:hypothetical protein
VTTDQGQSDVSQCVVASGRTWCINANILVLACLILLFTIQVSTVTKAI